MMISLVCLKCDILKIMWSTREDFELARVMLDHSLAIKPKEKVLITLYGEGGMPLAKAVYIETLKRGAYPLLDLQPKVGLGYQFYRLANEWQLNYVPEEVVKAKINWADVYVRIVADENLRELSQVEPEKLALRQKLMRPLVDPMIDSDRWILTYYPTAAMAQAAGVSLDWLREFYFESVLVDYDQMERELKALEKVLDEGKEVRVVGEETDLELRIEGRLALACYGERNIPDGEVFLAPLKETVEGRVYFEFPSMYMGQEVRGVRLVFEKGKVIKATAEVGQEVLESALETDEGARYLGEFAIGANKAIQKGMKNTLFDEKIGGTIHMALGRAYREKRGGGKNESAIHWDLVKDMRKPGSWLEVDGKRVLEEGRIRI